MKKIISLLIAAVMLFVSMPAVNAFAEDKEYSGSYEDKMTWEYDTESKTLKINCDGPLDFPYNMKYEYFWDMGEEQKMLIYKEYPWFVNGFASQVEHVELSGNVTEIGDYVFYKFYKLQEINIPETVTRIGVDAYYDADSITELVIPDSVTEIDTAAFSSMYRLESVKMSSNLKKLGGYAFSMDWVLTDLKLPSGITEMGPRILGTDFSKPCKNNIAELEDSVLYSGEYALAFAGNTKDVTVRDGTVLIADDFFGFSSSKPTSITLPDTLKYIGETAFRYSDIKSLTLPESVEKIGKEAFMNSQLESINIPEKVTEINSRLFANSKLQSISLHKNITRVSADAFDNSELKAITVDKANPNYCSADGVLFNRKKTSLIVYPKAKEGKHYNIPETVTTLYTDFSGKLETVAFPKSIKNCYKRVLKKIYYFGTEEEFAKINIPQSYNYWEKMTVKCCKAKLSATRYLYNKKVHTPKIKVYDAAGNRLREKKDYTVTLPKGRKKIGVYTVKVKLKGKFKGSFKLVYRIVPRGTEIKKLTAGASSFKVKWAKQNKNITGYQLQYSKTEKFSYGSKSIFINKKNATSKTVKELSVDIKYYVRVRTYKTVNGTKVYSKWSKVKKVKVKSPY